MEAYKGTQVVNGTWGEVWINSRYLAEVVSLKATITLDKTEVKHNKQLAKDYKVMAMTCKGSIKMHKVDSYFLKEMAAEIKQGKQPVFTIESKLHDPDSIGEERIVIRDATFDTLNLIDWEVGKVGDDSYNFTFSDYDIVETM
jgi:hypothetical protein|nr:MAG TPA: tail tube protein [Caudoviricetes sp.]